jgi:WD40-like Beta Propeller Repeat
MDVGTWTVPFTPAQPPLMGNGATEVLVGPGADSGSPNKFGGANDPNAPITVVYPPDGVVVPPNMKSIEFHFTPAAGQTLFEIKFQAPSKSLAIYTTCNAVGGGCVYQTNGTFWSNLVEYARGTVPVTYTIRGVNGSSPGPVGSSASRTIAFSGQDLMGGIYYWDTAGSIQRYDFGIPTVPAKTYLTQAQAGGAFCVGCHVMSRQGDRMLVGKDFPSQSPYALIDVATKNQFQVNGTPLAGQASHFSFSPNGEYFLESAGIKIAMRRIFDGAYITSEVVKPGTMPDWAPNGITMVYAKPQVAIPFGNPGVASASLETMDWNGTAWGQPKTLVPFGGQNNYYPTYSPTGDWVLFVRSPGDHESFSNVKPDPDTGQQPDGELWVVSSNGGQAFRLSTASDPGALSWPKWAPVRNDYHGGQILWATFSSPRAYGLRLANGQRHQIWMIGFDLQKAAAGQDPSLPAFWFPYQSIASGNHIAQWATEVKRLPCTSDGQCAVGESCTNGVCRPIP